MEILNIIFYLFNILGSLWLLVGLTFNIFYCFHTWFTLKRKVNLSDVLDIMLWPMYYVNKDYKNKIDNIISKLKK